MTNLLSKQPILFHDFLHEKCFDRKTKYITTKNTKKQTRWSSPMSKKLTPASWWPKATSPPQELEIWERSDPNF